MYQRGGPERRSKCEQTKALYDDQMFHQIAMTLADNATSGNGTKGVIVGAIDSYLKANFMNNLGQNVMSRVIATLTVPFTGPWGGVASFNATTILAVDASIKKSMESALRKANQILKTSSFGSLTIKGYGDGCVCQQQPWLQNENKYTFRKNNKNR
jgi:hypothetical protein